MRQSQDTLVLASTLRQDRPRSALLHLRLLTAAHLRTHGQQVLSLSDAQRLAVTGNIFEWRVGAPGGAGMENSLIGFPSPMS